MIKVSAWTGLASITFLLVAGCTSRIERDFMTGCVANGAPKEACSCAFDKLEEAYPEEVFDRMEKTGAIPDGFMETNINAMKSCVVGQ